MQNQSQTNAAKRKKHWLPNATKRKPNSCNLAFCIRSLPGVPYCEFVVKFSAPVFHSTSLYFENKLNCTHSLRPFADLPLNNFCFILSSLCSKQTTIRKTENIKITKLSYQFQFCCITEKVSNSFNFVRLPSLLLFSFSLFFFRLPIFPSHLPLGNHIWSSLGNTLWSEYMSFFFLSISFIKTFYVPKWQNL